MRILAGQFKGRRLLPPPRRAGTRPYTGRAKASVFGMLGPCLEGACILDLYCGTGTMGLEALSRGARCCYFADKDLAVIKRLQRNIEAVAAGQRSTIWRGDLRRNLQKWLHGLTEGVGVAFIDPPFAQTRRWDWAAVEGWLFAPVAAHFAEAGVIVLRTPAGLALPERFGPLAVARAKRYGDMVVTLLHRPD